MIDSKRDRWPELSHREWKETCETRNKLREFLLPYDAVRSASDPDAALLAFLKSTDEAAAKNRNWDRSAVECPREISMAMMTLPF